jgi:hypothetical protein
VVDIGTHHDPTYGTWKPKVYISWELPDEPMDDGRPFTVGRKLTVTLHENGALRPLLESWRGRAFTEDELRGFELKNLLGKPCMLNIVHEKNPTTGKVYAKIAAITPLPKRQTPPELVNPLRYYQIEDGSPPSDFPAWLVKLIGESREMKGTQLDQIPAPAPMAVDDDEIPF